MIESAGSEELMKLAGAWGEQNAWPNANCHCAFRRSGAATCTWQADVCSIAGLSQ